MGEFIASFLAFSLIIIALTLGAIYGKLRLHGSCGGEIDEDGEPLCELCSTDKKDCSLKGVKKKVALGRPGRGKIIPLTN